MKSFNSTKPGKKCSSFLFDGLPLKKFRQCFLLIAISFFSFQVIGQSPELAIGDMLPPATHKAFARSSPVDLSVYKDKLLILDFWASYCTGCIMEFPKMDSLQDRFGSNMQFWLVISQKSNDRKERIATIYQKMASLCGKPLILPTIIDDTVLTGWFPYKVLSHYVWINKGRIIGITGSSEVTAANIKAVIEGKPVSLKVRPDYTDFTLEIPLFVKGNGGTGESIIQRSMLSSPMEEIGRLNHQEEVPSTSKVKKRGDRMMTRLSIVNAYVFQLYQWAYHVNKPWKQIINVKDTAVLSQIYCYEILTPPIRRDSLLQLMRQDLDRFFGYKAGMQTRKVNCLVLQNVPAAKAWKQSSDSTDSKYEQKSINSLIRALESRYKVPVVDETGIITKVTFTIPKDESLSPDQMNIILRQYGLQLVQAIRPVEMFVIED